VVVERAVNFANGSAEPNKNKGWNVTEKQIEEIAKIKMPDLNCFDLDAAVRSVRSTCRSIGIDVL
jgi:large subunit ribosomal protein L11